MSPLVSIIMGSSSDMPVMKEAAAVLDQFEVPFELNIISAHRAPHAMLQFASESHTRGIAVIIAGAGGAAHLPGMVASATTLPVIGVPVKSSISLDGWDSILSILQMPMGIPVATVALNGAKNAGLLAVKILALSNPKLQEKLKAYKKELERKVNEMNQEISDVKFTFRIS